MDNLQTQLERWHAAQIIDSVTIERIVEFEDSNRQKRRWPMFLPISFGTLMLCAGVFLFVAAHWDEISPSARFGLALGLVAVFHVAASLLSSKAPNIGVALHLAGTAALGAGIFLAGQIFNMEEHWPGAILLWAIGAVLAWLILRQWTQAVLAAILIPWWLGGEWALATENYTGTWHIAAQGFLLLAILYMSTRQKESNRSLRVALLWAGALSLLPLIIGVIISGEWLFRGGWYYKAQPPAGIVLTGYLFAYLPLLVFAAVARKRGALPIFASAAWVFVLGLLTSKGNVENNPWFYLWLGVGACALCLWGVRDNRKLYINYGTVIFALTVIGFYSSEVLDKLGRSMGLILLGVIFLAGGWVLHRLRTGLIARALAGGN